MRINAKNFDKILVFIPPFLFSMADFGLTGVLKTVLSSILLFLLYDVLKSNRYNKILLLNLLIFIFYLFISLIWTNAFSYGFYKILLFSIWCFGFIIFKRIINENFEIFLKTIIFFFFLYILITWETQGSPFSILDRSNQFTRFSQSFVNVDSNPIWVARYIGFGIISLIFYLNYKVLSKIKYSKLELYIVILLIFTSFLYMLATNSRGPIISLIITLICSFYINRFYKNNNKIKRSNYFISFLLFLFAFFLIKQNLNLDFIRARFIFDDSVNSRLDHFFLAVSNINIKNIFFGEGIGNFGYIHNYYSVRSYPHNIFVEILYENGIFGVLFISLMIIYFFKIMVNYMTFERIYYFLCFIFFLINAQFSGDLISNINIFIFFILAYPSRNEVQKINNRYLGY